MRLFIAINCDEIEKYLESLQRKFSYPGLKHTDSYHITLKFLGEVTEKQKDQVVENLSKVDFDDFKIKTSDLGVFPNEKYISVLWLGIKNNEALNELYNDIEKSLKEFDFRRNHDFHPHITLSRVKYLKDKSGFKDKLNKVKTETKTINVNNFILYKSTLTSKGPIYEVVEKFN